MVALSLIRLSEPFVFPCQNLPCMSGANKFVSLSGLKSIRARFHGFMDNMFLTVQAKYQMAVRYCNPTERKEGAKTVPLW